MRKSLLLAGLLMTGAWVRAADDYRVGVADVLEIRVMDHRDLDGHYTVAPDGSVSFPMAGTVPVKGLTLDEVRKTITARLENGYLRYPVVTAALAKSEKKTRFFIYGEVKSPGEYPLPSQPVTAMGAVTVAGGVTKGGSEARVKILRPKPDGGAYEVIMVDLKSVMATGKGDVVVSDGDILIIQEGWF